MLGQTRIIRVCPNMALPIRQNCISLNVVKEKQFKEIFEALYPKVYGFALKALDQEWLAEEIAHTSFCKLWTHRNNLEIHSGRRNLGKQVAEYYQELAQNLNRGFETYFSRKAEIIKNYLFLPREWRCTLCIQTKPELLIYRCFSYLSSLSWR